jgi:hypothetical protein
MPPLVQPLIATVNPFVVHQRSQRYDHLANEIIPAFSRGIVNHKQQIPLQSQIVKVCVGRGAQYTVNRYQSSLLPATGASTAKENELFQTGQSLPLPEVARQTRLATRREGYLWMAVA